MNLVKSLELLKKIGDGKDYNKEFDYILVETNYDQVSANSLLTRLGQDDLDYINSKIDELQKSNLYQRKTQIHGKRHIENVMLFAMIIATIEGLDKNDKDLLLASAMYHDQGRDNDLDEQHGIESAYIAGQDLKDRYSEEELKIIQAAIMFHDDRTVGDSLKEIEDNGFDAIVDRLKINKESKERTRKIGNILKDADALDRARFVEDVCPIDEHYLRTDISKRMIKFAIELHEAYSIDDLYDILSSESDAVKQEVEDYKNATSPIRAKLHYIRNIAKK